MLTFNDKAITYDANGNMETITNSCGTTNYTWDARNRLTAINGFNTDCSALTASFKYDALGRRIEKSINGKTIQYLYDGLDIVQEIENGVVTANYVRTLNIDEPLSRIKADGTIRYYQQDVLGSVIALTDENGVIKTQYSYDPYGNTTIIGEISDNPFQYTGRENDGTGNQFNRGRYYNYELQRFISEDPIGFRAGDVNLFQYVQNRPTMFIDPLGLAPLSPAPLGPGAYGGGPGQTIGATVGWYGGAVAGAAAGTSIGMDLGFAMGASLGLGGGPLGSLGGGIVGGFAGGVVGGVVGGMAGGFLGGVIGHQFDQPCAGSLNCGEEEMLEQWRRQHASPCK